MSKQSRRVRTASSWQVTTNLKEAREPVAQIFRWECSGQGGTRAQAWGRSVLSVWETWIVGGGELCSSLWIVITTPVPSYCLSSLLWNCNKKASHTGWNFQLGTFLRHCYPNTKFGSYLSLNHVNPAVIWEN